MSAISSLPTHDSVAPDCTRLHQIAPDCARLHQASVLNSAETLPPRCVLLALLWTGLGSFVRLPQQLAHLSVAHACAHAQKRAQRERRATSFVLLATAGPACSTPRTLLIQYGRTGILPEAELSPSLARPHASYRSPSLSPAVLLGAPRKNRFGAAEYDHGGGDRCGSKAKLGAQQAAETAVT